MPTDSPEPRPETHVRFKPSKVEGLPGAESIEVYPDRLRVEAAGRWHEFAFADIAVRQEPAWVSRLKRLLRARPYRAHVGDLFYVREPYRDSYIRFYTEPRLTVYMPADGPTQYPHSHFWRVQEVLRRGGYAADDVNLEKEWRERELAKRPRWLRAAGRVLWATAWLNVVVYLATSIYFGGIATRSEDGKYYFAARGKREWEVDRRVWIYNRVHTRVVWVAFPLGLLGFYLAEVPQATRMPREREAQAPRSAAYGPPR